MTQTANRCLFVVGRQRTGTTVLRQALATHPRVRDLGEVMHDKRSNGFYAELAGELAKSATAGLHNRWFDILLATIDRLAPPGDDTIRLVDVKYNMALNFGSTFVGADMLNTFALNLRRHKGALIHVVRRNKLALLTSIAVVGRTGQWQMKHGDARRFERVELNPATLTARIAAEEAMDAYFAAQFARMAATVTVVYEDMFGPDGTFVRVPFDRVARRFGLDGAFDLSPRLTRQGLPLADTISNFDAIAARIENLVAAGSLPARYLDYLRS